MSSRLAVSPKLIENKGYESLTEVFGPLWLIPQQLNIDEENGETAERHGLLHRLERLSMAYQGERSDLEAHDPVRLLILALVEMATGYLRFGVSLMEFETSELVEHINRIAKDQEVVDGDEKVTNARRIGWLLKRLRFQKATPGKTRKRWKTTAAEIISLARAYGMTVSLGENDKNDENGETATV